MNVKDIHICLEACRVNAQKTQKEWAELLGVTNTTVCNWENGMSQPSLDQVRQISDLSGIPMDCIRAQQDSLK